MVDLTLKVKQIKRKKVKKKKKRRSVKTGKKKMKKKIGCTLKGKSGGTRMGKGSKAANSQDLKQHSTASADII